MFSGDFFLSHFSVNDSCYGSDGRLISEHFVLYTVEKFAPFSYEIFYVLLNCREKILPVQIRAQTRYHICASCIHGSFFLLTQDTNAKHILIENWT
jgi:hypothetical protein